MTQLTPNRFKGKLIIVEGIDGSGKSTQLALLAQWLRSQGLAVAFSEWNSSPLVSDTTRRGKKKMMFTPTTFSLIHATDFADRQERYIIPLLKAGAIVCADQPNLAFYFRVPLEVALGRILGGRDSIKYYEAGMDLNLAKREEESFRIFQGRILEQYDAMAEEMGFHIIDASGSIEEQQAQMRRIVMERLGDAVASGQILNQEGTTHAFEATATVL